MAVVYQTKKVVDYYHNGKRVLYKYHKIGNTAQLVYSAFAFGGYVKQGLVLQLDCSHNLVAGGTWTSMVGNASATINGTYTDGGIDGITLSSITLPDVDAAYWEVCALVNGEVVTTSYTSEPTISGTIFEVRGYGSELTTEQKSHNTEADKSNFDKIDDGITVLYYADGTYSKHDVSGTIAGTSSAPTTQLGDRINEAVKIRIGNKVTKIGNYAFNGCSTLQDIVIQNSVTSIGVGVFRDCKCLTSITIPNGVTNIGGSTFYGCSSLTNITIPNSVTNIGNWSFYGCSSLTSITIPNSVTSIENSSFYGCSSLTNITIPNSVTSIGVRVFYNCDSLTSMIVSPTTPPTLGTNAISTATTSIKVPAASVDAYKAADGWSAYASKISAIE